MKQLFKSMFLIIQTKEQNPQQNLELVASDNIWGLAERDLFLFGK